VDQYVTKNSAVAEIACIMPFKVIDFDTSRKPVCDFILVNNAKLHHTSHW